MDLPPTKNQIITRALQRAAGKPASFLSTFREVLEIHSAPRNPDGSRAKFSDRWRPVHAMSGKHPNSLAALEVHRWETVFGGPRSPKLRKCARQNRFGKKCGAVAIRGSAYCRLHGGAKAKEEALRRKWKDYRPDRTSLNLAALRKLAHQGMIPQDLIRDVPEFRECYKRARFGISYRDERFAQWSYGERRMHHEACTVLALNYLAAWEAMRERGDWNLWADCTRRAEQLGLAARHIV